MPTHINRIDDSIIKKIRTHLWENPKELLLFDVITQTGLDASQLLHIRVKDFLGMTPGGKLVERSDGKPPTVIHITPVVVDSWQRYLSSFQLKDSDFIFKSRKGNAPYTLSTLSRMVNSWFDAVGESQLRGVRSLYQIWKQHYKNDNPGLSGGEPATQKHLGVYLPITPAISMQEAVYDQLFRSIVSGKIAPGMKIVVETVAEQMGVSRIPVREAIHRLHEAGLLTLAPRQSAVVAELSSDNLKEITRIRLLLETTAVKEAARLRQEEDVVNLEGLHLEWLKSIDHLKSEGIVGIETYLEKNRNFHQTMYGLADMPILHKIIIDMWDKISPYLHILHQNYEEVVFDRIVHIHQGMLEGMKKGDGAKTAKWLSEDISNTEKSLLSLLGNQ